MLQVEKNHDQKKKKKIIKKNGTIFQNDNYNNRMDKCVKIRSRIGLETITMRDEVEIR